GHREDRDRFQGRRGLRPGQARRIGARPGGDPVRQLFLFSLCACTLQSSPPPGAAGPVEAAQQFAEAVHRGDTATAWSLLSARTRAEADKLAAAARALADAGPESGRQMLLTSALPDRPIEARQLS